MGQRILTLLENKITLAHLPSKLPRCSWESPYLHILMIRKRLFYQAWKNMNYNILRRNNNFYKLNEERKAIKFKDISLLVKNRLFY